MQPFFPSRFQMDDFQLRQTAINNNNILSASSASIAVTSGVTNGNGMSGAANGSGAASGSSAAIAAGHTSNGSANQAPSSTTGTAPGTNGVNSANNFTKDIRKDLFSAKSPKVIEKMKLDARNSRPRNKKKG